jgi:hypothetical protein
MRDIEFTPEPCKIPASINALNDMASICHNALVEVRLDNAWYLLSDETRNTIIKAMRLINN